MAAVEKAKGVLDSDDAKDLASRSLGFLQTDSTSRRTQASKILATASDKTQNRALASLAVSVRINAFVKVKKAIDDMSKALGQQKKDDITTRDYCLESFQANELSVEKRKREHKDEVVEIGELGRDIKKLQAQDKKLKAEIEDLKKQLKIQGEDRNKQNTEFQLTVTDQRATQKLLKSAKSALEAFYVKAAAAALLQQEQDAPVGVQQKTRKNNNASTGVMKILQQIINDSKALEAEAIRAEQEGQNAYEIFITKTNASIESKLAQDLTVIQTKEGKEQEVIVDIRDKKSLLVELEQLAKQAADLHKSCDFVTKNFELRQTGFAEEIEAMEQAKAVLTGSDAKFLQLRA